MVLNRFFVDSNDAAILFSVVVYLLEDNSFSTMTVMTWRDPIGNRYLYKSYETNTSNITTTPGFPCDSWDSYLRRATCDEQPVFCVGRSSGSGNG